MASATLEFFPVEDGVYERVDQGSAKGTTPFAPAPTPTTQQLVIDSDTVTFTYVDADGRTVEVTYDVTG